MKTQLSVLKSTSFRSLLRCLTTAKHATSPVQQQQHPQLLHHDIHSMKGMSLLTLKEFNQQQIEELLWTAIDMKALVKQKKSTELTDLLKGQSIAEVFEKRSTRTRFAFEAGAHCLGAHAILCNKEDIHLGVSETLKDTFYCCVLEKQIIMFYEKFC